MTRQQKIRYPLPNRILVPTIPTHQLPLTDLRLHQQRMQLSLHLLVGSELFCCWGGGGQGWESELLFAPKVSTRVRRGS